jgi:hypothetical protein
MAFTAIEPTAGLTPAQRRRVADVGPPDVLLRTSHPSLLHSAGFAAVTSDDVTSAYRSVLAAWLGETARRADEVIALVGVNEFEQRQQRRINALAAVDAGLLRRRMYVARRARGRGD